MGIFPDVRAAFVRLHSSALVAHLLDSHSIQSEARRGTSETIGRVSLALGFLHGQSLSRGDLWTDGSVVFSVRVVLLLPLPGSLLFTGGIEDRLRSN